MTFKKLQFQTQVLGDALVYERAAKVCIALIGILAIMYAYALGSTVRLVMQRSSIECTALELTSHIANLESNYLKLAGDITLPRGEALGLHEAKNISFVTRTNANVSALSLIPAHEL